MYSEDWIIKLGRPELKDDNTHNGKYGYKTVDNKWHDHAWLSNESGFILDLTADQFGGTPIYLGPLKPIYNANFTEPNIQSILEKLQKRVNKWLDEWKSSTLSLVPKVTES